MMAVNRQVSINEAMKAIEDYLMCKISLEDLVSLFTPSQRSYARYVFSIRPCSHDWDLKNVLGPVGRRYLLLRYRRWVEGDDVGWGTRCFLIGVNDDGLLFVNEVTECNASKVFNYTYDVAETEETVIEKTGTYRVQGDVAISFEKTVRKALLNQYIAEASNALADRLGEYARRYAIQLIYYSLLRIGISAVTDDSGNAVGIVGLNRDYKDEEIRLILRKAGLNVDDNNVLTLYDHGELPLRVVLFYGFTNLGGRWALRIDVARAWDYTVIAKLLGKIVEFNAKERFMYGNHYVEVENSLPTSLTLTMRLPYIRRGIQYESDTIITIDLLNDHIYVGPNTVIRFVHQEHGVKTLRFAGYGIVRLQHALNTAERFQDDLSRERINEIIAENANQPVERKPACSVNEKKKQRRGILSLFRIKES